MFQPKQVAKKPPQPGKPFNKAEQLSKAKALREKKPKVAPEAEVTD